jgi:hypothetical protein
MHGPHTCEWFEAQYGDCERSHPKDKAATCRFLGTITLSNFCPNLSETPYPSVLVMLSGNLFITRNMGQDGDGHAHFDQIWRPNITINYMGVDQNIKF